ncbi:MAG: fasciclin domain-containing protein [Rhodothermales bacterium]
MQVAGDAVTVNGARVVATDIYASNGVVHVIEAVLLPPSGN